MENLLLSSLTYYSVFSSGLDDLKSLTKKENNGTVLSMVQNLTILRVSFFCVEHLLCVCVGGVGRAWACTRASEGMLARGRVLA